MELFYRTKGSFSLPPLIILHGLWGASDNWLPIADLLSSDFHVIIPDLRNHGHSPHSPLMDYESLSIDLEAFITQLNLPQPPFIAGHSMGGKILMYLLLKQPEFAKKAAIIDICPKTYTPAPTDFHLRLLDYIQATSLRSFLKRTEIHTDIRAHFTSEQECQILFKNLRQRANGFEWKINADAIKNHFYSIMSWPETANNKTYISEILFIKAEHSNYMAKEITDDIKRHFTAAQQTIIPKASHFIHVDQPLRLANTLSDFFLPSHHSHRNPLEK